MNFPYKYHFFCFEHNTRKKISGLSRGETPPPTKRVSWSAMPEFDWNCGTYYTVSFAIKCKTRWRQDALHGRYVPRVSTKQSFESRKREVWRGNCKADDIQCLFQVNHADCLAKYRSTYQKHLDVQKGPNLTTIWCSCCQDTWLFADTIEVGKFVLVPIFCDKYREFIIAEGVSLEVANACRTQVILIRNKLPSSSKCKTISFHSQTGNLPNIMCSNSLSVAQ